MQRDGLIEVKDARGFTPLHWAAKVGNVSAIRWLIKHGADVFSKDMANATPLHYAVVSPTRRRLESIKAILHSRLVHVVDCHGQTPLHWLAGNCHLSAHLDAVCYLILCKPDLKLAQSIDDMGNTPLHSAAASSSLPGIVPMLVQFGADLKAVNVYGDTPLHTAAGFGNTSIPMLKSLIGADSISERCREAMDQWFSKEKAGLSVHTPVLQKLRHSISGSCQLLDHTADLFKGESVEGQAQTAIQLPVSQTAHLSQANNAGYTPLQQAVVVGWSQSTVRRLTLFVGQHTHHVLLLDLLVSRGWRQEVAEFLLDQALTNGISKSALWKSLHLMSQRWGKDASSDGGFMPRLQIRFASTVTYPNKWLRLRLWTRLTSTPTGEGKFATTIFLVFYLVRQFLLAAVSLLHIPFLEPLHMQLVSYLSTRAFALHLTVSGQMICLFQTIRPCVQGDVQQAVLRASYLQCSLSIVFSVDIKHLHLNPAESCEAILPGAANFVPAGVTSVSTKTASGDPAVRKWPVNRMFSICYDMPAHIRSPEWTNRTMDNLLHGLLEGFKSSTDQFLGTLISYQGCSSEHAWVVEGEQILTALEVILAFGMHWAHAEGGRQIELFGRLQHMLWHSGSYSDMPARYCVSKHIGTLSSSMRCSVTWASACCKHAKYTPFVTFCLSTTAMICSCVPTPAIYPY